MQDAAQAAPEGDATQKEAEELVGQRLSDRFELVRLLGVGGMGAAYEARDHSTRPAKRVAAKLMHRHLKRHDGACRRFVREAGLLRHFGSLGVPGLVRLVHDESGATQPFFVMEFVEGRPLADQQVPEGAGFVIRVIASVLTTLTAMHAHGTFHRDVKPANIMVSGTVAAPRVVLLDFGIAHDESDAQSLTRTGDVMGTPWYMSPEQFRGLRVDARSDLYAVGAVAMMLLTGRSMRECEFAHYDVKLDELVAECPVAVRTWLKRALALDPERRYQNATEMASALPSPESMSASAGPSRLALPSMLITAKGTVEEKTTQRDAKARRAPQEKAPNAKWLGAMALAGFATAVAMLWPAPIPTPERRLRIDAGSEMLVPRAMARIQGGDFEMGSRADEAQRALGRCPDSAVEQGNCDTEYFEREQPAHLVHVGSFQLDRTEVTAEDFATFVAGSQGVERSYDDASRVSVVQRDHHVWAVLNDPQHEFAGRSPFVFVGGRFGVVPSMRKVPATLVTWNAARAYCESRGARLPREAEWEYAARGSARREYPWGDNTADGSGTVFMRTDSSLPVPTRWSERAQDRTPEGVFDLAGNVAEWVDDRAAAYPGAPSAFAARQAALAARNDLRVVRGGSFRQGADLLRAATRSFQPSRQTAPDVGFRCAR